jgi:hypothetical protein
MQLKLSQLVSVVKEAMKSERALNNLRDEIFRVLGPSVMISENSEVVCKEANDRLDVLEGTGRFPRSGSFKTSVLIEASICKSIEARKLAARLLPENHIKKFLDDKSQDVRSAAAKRMSYRIVKEAIKRYPKDELLKTIARDKKIEEAGIPNAKSVNEPFDMYGKEPLGDSARTFQGPDLPGSWYERLAQKLTKEYGTNLEGQWEEILATNVSRAEASFGHTIDRDKLLKKIYACIEEREDAILDEGYLKRTVARLKEESLTENFIPILAEEDTCPVSALLSLDGGPTAFIAEAEKVFLIRKSEIPRSLRKNTLLEGTENDFIPISGMLPMGRLGSLEEKALDSYVSMWNSQHALRGEPYMLTWSPHSLDGSRIGFSVTLK